MRSGLWITLGLYLAACCLPVLDIRKGSTPDPMWGANALIVGWSGLFAAVFGWYANPFWFVGMIFAIMRKPRIAALFGVIAIAIACTVFTDFGRILPADEGNVTKMRIVGLLPGAYLWFASLLSLPVTAFLARK